MGATSSRTNLDYFHHQSVMLDLLARWVKCGWLRAIDELFAGFLAREVPTASPWVILAAALASHQLGRGQVCLNLADTLRDPAFALSLPPEGNEFYHHDTEPPPLPSVVLKNLRVEDWQNALAEESLLVNNGAGNTPLVMSGCRVYLRRFWQCEQEVCYGIQKRLEATSVIQNSLSIQTLGELLDTLFPAHSQVTPDWQKLALALAARTAFTLITGGPGTGKTTTVVRLLALLQMVALAKTPSKPLRIRLAAPTGKAAARLNESIVAAIARLMKELPNGEAVQASIPVHVVTVHRLLGTLPGSRHFRHHADNPLALDVLVIDEASMVDLEMMAAVLAALPNSARLVLLGDKDQLASVEAGGVLGELCQRAAEGHYTPATCDWLQAVTGTSIDPVFIDHSGTALDQAVVMLRHSHRFSATSGIGQLAAAVNGGDIKSVNAIWQKGHAELTRLSIVDSEEALFNSLVTDGGYRHYLEILKQKKPANTASQSDFDNWARAVLQAHGQFQLLCALRGGPWGVEGLNLSIARHLYAAGLIPACENWYLGRPVLVTHNDYELGLMNGDIGITLERGGGLRVAFPSGDGQNGIQWFLPSRLQNVETVYALTIHKAQGSEFTHAAMVLPDTINPILTRELIYTGITRARARF
ncbi:MAG: exodeoxyribonuclease V subunit alpha, partial [Magnetococcales bacterium]|nr:exodeoxyribonuclease V subunit alpha [Magnetococcales bacterium]